MTGKIAAERFLDAFRGRWKEEDFDKIREGYRAERDWTEFMLEEK